MNLSTYPPLFWGSPLIDNGLTAIGVFTDCFISDVEVACAETFNEIFERNLM